MSHFTCCSPCTPLNVPYTAPISCTLQKGRSITICGVPRCGATRFSVNLVCGSSFDCDDVAFHFDVRFNYGLSQCTVVRNSRTCGHWGTEEVCAPCFPFNVNVPFEMRICTKSEKLKIYINNSHFIDFKYRLPVQRVTFLHIQGDLNLTQVVL
ncbi:galectin-7 [Biomphalaria glabrata]|uniref:Galectin n=1 Tax=Biomphalaria glabrata TaxID=6526 RepID=A0A9W3AHY1_BIOGL|nr:galectin-7-like isoform X1 [Biomphalaria glabrata]KAI8754305.1 galectin-7 galectin-7-like Cell adhesion [Biomphalaria glabrata]